MKQYDVAIIGAGMAGASLASELAGDLSVALLETEDVPGYHSTGRSAAFWTESYGGPLIQPLTTASGHFLRKPPPEFSEASFLTRRTALNIGRRSDAGLLEKFEQDYADSGIDMERWDRAAIAAMAPGLSAEWTEAIYEPDCCDIDVALLHMAYLRDARKKGAVLLTRHRVSALQYADNMWSVESATGSLKASMVINAAGAWSNDIAQMAGAQPISVTPYRRTMIQLQTAAPVDPSLPLLVAVDGSFYFKPASTDSYWLSPHDETACPAGDVAPEELDIAIAIDRFEKALDIKVTKVERSWAGLRSFSPDRLPVIGHDNKASGFFWFAGQGGFGIQTAPAAAKLARYLILQDTPSDLLQEVDGDLYAADRFG